MDSKRVFRDLENKVSVLGLSKQTYYSYVSCMRLFCSYFETKEHPTHINSKEIEEFIVWVKENHSISQARQSFWSLRFWYTQIEKQPNKMKGIQPIRLKHRIQIPLQKDAILKVITTIKDKRHKAIISLLFATGLRLNEAAKLRIKDIDGLNGIIVVRSGKGGKDRFVQLPENLRMILRDYLKSLPTIPKEWLFQGQKESNYISPSTIYEVCKKYLNVNPHKLRHSYASAIRNSGVDLLDIRDLLGHNSLKTTEIYLHNNLEHIKTLKNPIDGLRAA